MMQINEWQLFDKLAQRIISLVIISTRDVLSDV
jgi:hypothetical protein